MPWVVLQRDIGLYKPNADSVALIAIVMTNGNSQAICVGCFEVGN
jgi:hypothetical protein